MHMIKVQLKSTVQLKTAQTQMHWTRHLFLSTASFMIHRPSSYFMISCKIIIN